MVKSLPEPVYEQALSQLTDAQNILIITHIRADGDAIGSLLGLGIALIQAGKHVQLVSEDGVPPAQRRLEGIQHVKRFYVDPVDLSIVVDCSDIKRTGDALKNIDIPDWNIDHHVTNQEFASLNFIDPLAVATAEIIVDLIPCMGLTITKPVADALLTGIIADTLGFQTSNMTPKVLRIAAELMERGANLPTLYRESLIQRSFHAVRFWGSGLGLLEKDNRIVWTTLTMADRQAAGYSGRDDADLINILSSIEEADIAIIFVEQQHGKVKVSWRSRPGWDVTKIAANFGGGGHAAASGAEIQGELSEVRSCVLNATQLLWENSRHEQKH
jgi:phosphoesterase RecJ-like protein